MSDKKSKAKRSNQAVLMIHGIGEQVPMKTLRDFVDTTWTKDRSQRYESDEGDLYSGPDRISNNFELRRLITSRNKRGVRTDFFEYYWAHKVSDTKAWQVLKWIGGLLQRPPNQSTKSVRFAWTTARWITVASMLLACALAFPQVRNYVPIFKNIGLTITLFPIIFGGVINAVLLRTVGDAARYLTPAAYNITRRQEIRRAGVDILSKLIRQTNSDGSQKYDRIIVVGHSLGAVVGYDILTATWPIFSVEGQTNQSLSYDALKKVEEASANPDEIDAKAFRDLQYALREELRHNGSPWNVTDFVTIGSPLSHAAWLMADSDEDFEQKRTQREFPHCPPYAFGNKEKGRFSYSVDRYDREEPYEVRLLDHSAVFGPVRWTNIYFHSSKILHGDVISGPVSHLFGRGIIDIQAPHPARWNGLLSHLHYWKFDPRQTADNRHIKVTQEALNLLNLPDPFSFSATYIDGQNDQEDETEPSTS